jgi:hypothetical protein
MAFDAHKNLAVSSVATPPAPPGTGLSLNVAAGDGARFPAPPFNATVWPATASPTPANAEILRVTAIAGDNLTIARMQEGTAARAIAVGDLIAATITAKTLTDLETQGTWITVPQAATVIATVGPGAATLGAYYNHAWTRVGNTVTIAIYLQVVVTGTPLAVSVALPPGIVATGYMGVATPISTRTGMMAVLAGDTGVFFYWDGSGTTSWAPGTYLLIGVLPFQAN